MYHFNIKKLYRAATKSSPGRCSVQKYCYITASKGKDLRTGKIYNSTKKAWEVIYQETFLCKEANPEWKSNPLMMFNEIERICIRENEVLALDINAALPKVLTKEEMIEVTEKYAKWLTDKGFCATVAIHDKMDSNPHLHILATTRPCKDGQFQLTKTKRRYELDEEGNKIAVIDPNTGEQKIRIRKRIDKNGKEYVSSEKVWKQEYYEENQLSYSGRTVDFRKTWADVCNEYLSEENKISHLSYKEQGINKIPQKHLSYQVRAMEERGEVTFKGAAYKDTQILQINKELEDEQTKLNQYQETLILRLKNKLQLRIEEKEKFIINKIESAYKKIKSFFIKNINHIKREIWNNLLPEYGAYSVLEISNDVAKFIKNNSKVSELYEGSVSDEIYSDIKKKKFNKVVDIIKDCLNENNQTEGNRLISLIDDMKDNSSEEKLALKQVMKM